MLLRLEKWIDELQASGKYSFLRAQAITGTGASTESVKKALQRQVRNGRIVKVKDYFYVIVPLEYSKAGARPVNWFIHQLMNAMRLPYYAGLLTAAAQYGASSQQPQEFQVITDRSVRALTVGRARIHFFASQFISRIALTDVKTPTGIMRVSSPEATAVDLVRFSRVSGFLDHVAAVIADLAPSLDAKRLLAAVRAVGDVPNAQRLGYILDQHRLRQLSRPIHAWIERQHPHPLLLRPGKGSSALTEETRWHLLIDRPLEIEGVEA